MTPMKVPPMVRWQALLRPVAAQQQAQAGQEQAKKDAEAAQAEKIATYNRAVGACLEARGYTVK
jgi:hypothetical protein